MTFMIDPVGINGEEIEFWNGPQGQNWVKQNRLTDFMYDPFGGRALERANLKPGEKVIDVGCGCGKTTAKIIDQVAPDGRVTAVDVSIPMLEVARARLTKNQGVADFVSADAASYDFEPETYDVLYSQFGLMFFHNLDEAFANLFGALKPGGRVSFVCWRDPKKNPFLIIPFEAVRSFVPEMPVPSPDVPSSPFALAPEARTRGLLEVAGFVDVKMEEFDHPTPMGQGSLEECLEFVADFSNPVATALRKCGPELAPKILAEVRQGIEPYYSDETIKLPAASWIVTARRP